MIATNSAKILQEFEHDVYWLRCPLPLFSFQKANTDYIDNRCILKMEQTLDQANASL